MTHPQKTTLLIEVNFQEYELDLTGDLLDQRLSKVLLHHELPLNTRCAGKGLCQGCMVELIEGELERIDSDKVVQATEQPGMVRACQHRVGSTRLRLRLPSRSVLAHRPQVVSEFAIEVPFAHHPLVLGDDDGFSRDGEVADQGRLIFAAVDIGTTTVALLLVDCQSGEILARQSGFNHQMHLGDDVLTRINLCLESQANVARLQKALWRQTLGPMLEQALNELTEPAELRGIVAAGNTTMAHLAVGENPGSMGLAPFTPRFTGYQQREDCQDWLASEESVAAGRSKKDTSAYSLHLMPAASAYVGGDVVAGLLASGMAYRSDPCLLVDIGTNGEIVLKHDKQIIGCATAAGPAFEGGRLLHGVRAGDGAISHIALDPKTGEVNLDIVGQGYQGDPIGLCGTAYIDFLAQARQANVITPSGRFANDEANPFARKLMDATHGKRFIVYRPPAPESVDCSDQCLTVTELDMAHLLQAKAAIAAGIATLLDHLGLAPSDIATLYLAGGFGMHLNLDHAIAMGLLPGFKREQVKLVGNTSLAGAYLAGMDRTLVDEMSEIAEQIEVLELNLQPGFEDAFIDHLALA